MDKGVTGKCGSGHAVPSAAMGDASFPGCRYVGRLAAGLSVGRYKGPLWPQPLRWAAPANTAPAHTMVFQYFNIVKL